MTELTLKAGDRVRVKKKYMEPQIPIVGMIGIVTENINYFEGEKIRAIEFDIPVSRLTENTHVGPRHGHYWFIPVTDEYLEVVKGKAKSKVVQDDLVRYMVYGQGCDNKSQLMNSEQDLRKEMENVVTDDAWSGRIIGYKLTPLYEIQRVSKITSLQKSKRK